MKYGRMDLDLWEYANEFLKSNHDWKSYECQFNHFRNTLKDWISDFIPEPFEHEKRLEEYESFPNYPSIFTLPLSYLAKEGYLTVNEYIDAKLKEIYYSELYRVIVTVLEEKEMEEDDL